MNRLENLKSEKFKPLSSQQLKSLKGGLIVTTDPRPGYDYINFIVGGQTYQCDRDEYTTDGNGTWISARYHSGGSWHDIPM